MKKLERQEMKNLKGGIEDDPSGTCAWHNGTTAICNISQATAQAYVTNSGGNWCCSSCPPNLNCY
ncbi:MAG: hypothetical protein ABIP79_02510 [Chitinophagaceae bacterium]